MMSYEAIRSESRRAAQKAAKAKKLPIIVEAEDLEMNDKALLKHAGRAPFLGDYVPKGWEVVDCRTMDQLDPKAQSYLTLFVDIIGLGHPSEPALTHDEFVSAVRSLGAGYGYGIAEAGQFQVNIHVFRQVKQ